MQLGDWMWRTFSEFLTDRIARYKIPESYEFANGYLRDDAGKVRRSALRDERTLWLREGRLFRVEVANPGRPDKPISQLLTRSLCELLQRCFASCRIPR